MEKRSADDLRKKFYDGKWRCHREFRLAQEHLGDEVVFDALFGVFLDDRLLENRYFFQKKAGRCMLGLLPCSHYDIEESIYKCLRLWNRSVEELPWYFYKIYGKEKVLRVLEHIELKYQLTENEKIKINTFRYWLRPDEGYLAQRIEEYKL